MPTDGFELSFAVFAPVACAATGAILHGARTESPGTNATGAGSPASRRRQSHGPALRRDREERWIGGVAAGIARRYGIDVWLVRFAFVATTAAGGFGLILYALGLARDSTGRDGGRVASPRAHGACRRGGRAGHRAAAV